MTYRDFMPWLDYEYFWVVEVFLIIFITLCSGLLARKLLNQLHLKTEKTKTPWDDGLVDALRAPVTWCVWLFGVSFAADMVSLNLTNDFFEVTNQIRKVGSIVLVTWFLLRLIKQIEINLQTANYQTKPMDETTARALGKLIRGSVFITAALIIMQSFGYSISGILAFGGIGGIAIGFAAKDLLANFFGGLMIYLDRPFKVGDWIKSPDRDIEGTVEDIGWRLTRIRTFDKRPLYVPNSVFTQIALENPSRMLNRRIYETIGIRYDDANQMPAIVSDVKAMLMKHDSIDQSQTLMVNFNAFADSSLDFFIYTFTKTTNWVEFHAIKQDVLIKILSIIESHGAECAFPTSTLHIEPNNFEGINDNIGTLK